MRDKNNIIIALLSSTLLTSGYGLYLTNQNLIKDATITKLNNNSKFQVEQNKNLSNKNTQLTNELTKSKTIISNDKKEIEKLNKENKELKNKLADLHIKPQWNP